MASQQLIPSAAAVDDRTALPSPKRHPPLWTPSSAEPYRRPATLTSSLDHLLYPHIMDDIVFSADHSALLALRAANSHHQARVDDILWRHAVVAGIRHPLHSALGRHPILFREQGKCIQWPTTDLSGIRVVDVDSMEWTLPINDPTQRFSGVHTVRLWNSTNTIFQFGVSFQAQQYIFFDWPSGLSIDVDRSMLPGIGDVPNPRLRRVVLNLLHCMSEPVFFSKVRHWISSHPLEEAVIHLSRKRKYHTARQLRLHEGIVRILVVIAQTWQEKKRFVKLTIVGGDLLPAKLFERDDTKEMRRDMLS